MVKFLYRLIFISLILSAILIPLFFTSINEELFEFIKMLAVYILAITVIASYLVIRVAQKRWRWQKSPLDIAIGLLLISQVLSTVLSIHPATSFFGYYTRFHGGLLSTFAYVAIFYVVINYLRDLPYPRAVKSIQYLLLSILFGALLVGLYAIPEHFGHSTSCLIVQGSFDVACWVQDVQNRVFATIGQPNWLAAYMIMVIPLAVVGLLSGRDRQTKVRNTFIKLGWLSLVIVFYLTLVFTKSRSGWLGLVTGLVIFGSGWLIAKWQFKKSYESENQSKKSSHSRQFFGGSLIFATLIGVLIVISGVFGTPFSPSLIGVAQTETTAVVTPTGTSLESGGTESGEIRKIVWQGAFRVWQRYPVLGSGLETFAYSYYQDRPMAHNLVSEWNFLYNKAHNEFLNYLATTGLVGLLSYLIFLGWGCWLGVNLFWQRVKKLTHQNSLATESSKLMSSEIIEEWSFVISPLLPLALVSSITALSVSNFFGFSTVMVTLLMYIFLAIVSVLTIFEKSPNSAKISSQSQHNAQSLSRNQRRRLEKETDNFNQLNAPSKQSANFSTWWQYCLTSLIFIIALVLIWNTFNWWMADAAFARGKSLIRNNQWQVGLDTLISASARSPKEALYTDTLSEQYAQLAIKLSEVNEATLSAEFTQAAQLASDQTIKLNPVHLNFWKTRIRLYSQLSVLDPQYLTQTKSALESAIQLAPTDPALVFNQGKIAQFEENWPEAETFYLKSIEMKPNLVDARMALAALYEQLNRPTEASQQYQYLLDNVNPDDEVLKNRISELETASGQRR